MSVYWLNWRLILIKWMLGFSAPPAFPDQTDKGKWHQSNYHDRSPYSFDFHLIKYVASDHLMGHRNLTTRNMYPASTEIIMESPNSDFLSSMLTLGSEC